MSVTGTVCRQILTMIFYMGIGVVLFRRTLISKEGSRSLANLLLYFVLPCVIFQSFCIPRTVEHIQNLLVSFGMAATLLIVSMLVATLLLKRTPIDNFAAAFSNAGFMGLPIVTAVLGSEGVFYVAGFIALLNLLQWTYGQWILSRDRKKISVAAVLKNPIMLSSLAGVIMFVSDIPIPAVMENTLSAISGLNTPLSMIVLGTYLAQTKFSEIIRHGRLYVVSCVRLLLIPCISLLILLLLPQCYEKIALALFLAAAAPVGSNVAIYAQRLDQDYRYAVQLVCASTVLSMLCVPIMSAIAQKFLL